MSFIDVISHHHHHHHYCYTSPFIIIITAVLHHHHHCYTSPFIIIITAVLHHHHHHHHCCTSSSSSSSLLYFTPFIIIITAVFHHHHHHHHYCTSSSSSLLYFIYPSACGAANGAGFVYYRQPSSPTSNTSSFSWVHNSSFESPSGPGSHFGHAVVLNDLLISFGAYGDGTEVATLIYSISMSDL